MTEQGRLPGGAYNPLPFFIDGRYYDPNSLKLIKTPDGQEKYVGREITKVEAFSLMFWAKGQPKGMREAMVGTINSAFLQGQFALSAEARLDENGRWLFSQGFEQKLAAYKVLAKELGFAIGEIEYHPDAGTVIAPITEDQK